MHSPREAGAVAVEAPHRSEPALSPVASAVVFCPHRFPCFLRKTLHTRTIPHWQASG